MFCRTMLAALCLGFVFAAYEADARPAGHGASRPAVSAPRTLQRFQHAPAINRTTQSLHVTRLPHRRPFHHHFGRWQPFVFAAPYVVGDYGVAPPTAFVQSDSVPPGAPVIINGRSCLMQPHTVASEDTGAMRIVTVTRCY